MYAFPVQASALPAAELQRFVVFVFRLSRTSKPLHRLVAVEVAWALVQELPAPFTRAAGYEVSGAAGGRVLSGLGCPAGVLAAQLFVCSMAGERDSQCHALLAES